MTQSENIKDLANTIKSKAVQNEKLSADLEFELLNALKELYLLKQRNSILEEAIFGSLTDPQASNWWLNTGNYVAHNFNYDTGVAMNQIALAIDEIRSQLRPTDFPEPSQTPTENQSQHSTSELYSIQPLLRACEDLKKCVETEWFDSALQDFLDAYNDHNRQQISSQEVKKED